MIVFARSRNVSSLVAIETQKAFSQEEKSRLTWLLNADLLEDKSLRGFFIGPRKEMVSPWSTNAVEITRNMGIEYITRMEEFFIADDANATYDPMLQVMYTALGQELFSIDVTPEPVKYISDIAAYNQQEGLALSPEEIEYLEKVAGQLGRGLTDSEVFGFSQVNSEHCRHKIFNGTFIIDGEEQPSSLFQLIKRTTKENPNTIVSAYKDNVSFSKGPVALQFAPVTQDKADYFQIDEREIVLSLKAETHNFPTTVEPFNGAATGAGGEIRDRMAGGKAGVPMAGSAIYMTSYSRLEHDRKWEQFMEARPWLYQAPVDILIKASDGASDFGNKFGQPLINGSVLTFENVTEGKKCAFDKVIMLAGGVGYGVLKDAQKDTPAKGDKIVIMGGDNYRIGMGGSAVSSMDTGELQSAIELNAVQRSNPEMQKRVANAIRAMLESGVNPIVSIHDHGAGGHLNCLSELVEDSGGTINLRDLPIGDPTLSAKEIIGNESQERMGLVIKEKDIPLLQKIALRERAPFYVVGEITGDMHFAFIDTKNNERPIDLQLELLFGKPPKTVMEDETVKMQYPEATYDSSQISAYLEQVIQLEAVACKDWLTNKVDRSVTGKVARQQNVGVLQLPLSNLGAVAVDYTGGAGISSAVGHAPVPSMVDVKAGSRLAIAEAVANSIFAPYTHGLKGISLSANWMWPCRNAGEDARLYNAVEAVSDFACTLGVNIPTGKDSLSMTQKYKGETVYAPGTVVISASGEISDIKKIVTPELKPVKGSDIIYLPLSDCGFELGGSALGQILNALGTKTPDVEDAAYLATVFETVQKLIREEELVAGHDVSDGGLLVTLLEMCFPNQKTAMELDLRTFDEKDSVRLLFSQKPALILQVKEANKVLSMLGKHKVHAHVIGRYATGEVLSVKTPGASIEYNIKEWRKKWFKTSWLLDRHQTAPALADERYDTFDTTPVKSLFPEHFSGSFNTYEIEHSRRGRTGTKAAIIREKGVNGDREMAYSLHLAGFDVKDVHMTDLIAGTEDLSDVSMIVFVGGFSNSDVLGSAKGWAGAFLYNEKAKDALDRFYAREDTLSLGVCNGCQLMAELGLVYPGHQEKPVMQHNDSGKFESAYVTVEIPENNTVMLESLSGAELGIWVAHGEGKFEFPQEESDYAIPMKYLHKAYPASPNGSMYSAAAISSYDGRHLAMMPHLERSVFPWQCGYYPYERLHEDCTPWLEAFVNARKWVEGKKG